MGRGHLPCSLRHNVLVTHLVALFFSCHCCCCRYYVSCAHTVPAFDRFQRANLTLSLPRCRRCFGTFVLVRVCPLESLSGWGGRGGVVGTCCCRLAFCTDAHLCRSLFFLFLILFLSFLQALANSVESWTNRCSSSDSVRVLCVSACMWLLCDASVVHKWTGIKTCAMNFYNCYHGFSVSFLWMQQAFSHVVQHHYRMMVIHSCPV